MQLDVLHRGMLQIAQAQSWHSQPLEQARTACLLLDLNYQFYVKNKFKLSPNRKFTAGIWCDWQITDCRVYLVVLNKEQQQVYKQPFTTMAAQNGEKVYQMDFKWFNDDIVLITDKNHSVWQVDVKS